MKHTWLLFALLLLALPAAAREMYSWTDANGVKHFSDSPPPSSISSAKKLKVSGGVTHEAAADAADDATAGKGEGQALAAAAGYSADEIKHNCGIARRNLELLNAQAPANAPSGDQADAEALARHQSQIDKANQQIKLFCQ